MGHAMSMAALILQAGDSRIMTKNSRIMIHAGSITLPADSHPEMAKRWIDHWAKEGIVFENIILEKIKQKHPKITLKYVRELMKFDRILTSEEALDYNLIDEII